MGRRESRIKYAVIGSEKPLMKYDEDKIKRSNETVGSMTWIQKVALRSWMEDVEVLYIGRFMKGSWLAG